VRPVGASDHVRALDVLAGAGRERHDLLATQQRVRGGLDLVKARA
jgi:hypothetical protein